jgi:alpha-1,3-rhamnosyl/mannosyltransferase
MRVAIDGRRLQDDPLTGGGRWLRHLLPHLREQFDLVLLTDARRPSPALDGVEEVRLGVPGHLPEPFWLHGPVARWLRRFDGVFHATYNALPLSYRGPSVLTLHDLSWEQCPEDFAAAKRASFLVQARWSVRRAGAVVTISAFSRDAIVSTYAVPAARIVVAPPAVDPAFGPQRAAEVAPVLARLGVDGPYVVALGGSPRRGLEVAVAAWQRLPVDRPSLVVVGAERPAPARGVVWAGRLPDPQWSALLAGAMALCYPTRYEGYGMPALEAAASGVPVVCARTGPLPEVLGDAAEWCASASVADIAGGLAQVVGDPGRRQTLRAAGLARVAAAPSWAQSADQVARAYRLAAG